MCHYISGQYRAYCGAVLHCRQFYDGGSRRCGKNRGAAFTGSAVIGVGGPVFEFFTSASLGKVLIFIVVVIILQFRPKGIFSISSRVLDE